MWKNILYRREKCERAEQHQERSGDQTDTVQGKIVNHEFAAMGG
jgi:hypothetical protein